MSCFERHSYVKYTNIPYIDRFGVPIYKMNPLQNDRNIQSDNRTIIRSTQPNQCISSILPVNGMNNVFARYTH